MARKKLTRAQKKHRCQNQGLPHVVQAGVCRVCGCTDERSCMKDGTPLALGPTKKGRYAPHALKERKILNLRW